MSKPILLLAPVCANFEFRADHVNKKGVSSRQGIRKHVIQAYFKNLQINCSFVKCPVFLTLLVLPMSYVISDLVIGRSVLDVLCSE